MGSGFCAGPSDLQCCVSGTQPMGVYGNDVSTATSQSAYSCLRTNNPNFGTFTVPRGYKSSGAVDTAVCTSLNNALAAVS